jgi:hypothetical protein
MVEEEDIGDQGMSLIAWPVTIPVLYVIYHIDITSFTIPLSLYVLTGLAIFMSGIFDIDMTNDDETCALLEDNMPGSLVHNLSLFDEEDLYDEQFIIQHYETGFAFIEDEAQEITTTTDDLDDAEFAMDFYDFNDFDIYSNNYYQDFNNFNYLYSKSMGWIRQMFRRQLAYKYIPSKSENGPYEDFAKTFSPTDTIRDFLLKRVMKLGIQKNLPIF